MRVLILGSSTINKGAEAMLRTVQAELGDRLPGAEFVVGDQRVRQWHPEQMALAGVPVATPPSQGRLVRHLRLVRYALGAPEGASFWMQGKNRNRHHYIDALAGAVDAAVDVSGFLFSDQRGPEVSAKHASIVEIFRKRGKPFVFLPQAWGPFEKAEIREYARRAASNASLVFARDAQSYEHLTQALGSEGADVQQAPDIAFLFRPAASGAALLTDLGLDPDSPIAAIAPNLRVYERTAGAGRENVYVRMLTRISHDLREQGAQILLMPHELIPRDNGRDDRYVCELIAEALNGAGVAAVMEDRRAEDLKAMLSRCDILVGSRFHALIAALSSGVPAVAVGWAHKYPELFREFDLERLVLDHDTLTEDALVETVHGVWEDRASIRKQITDRLPQIKARSSAVFDLVASAIAPKRS